MGIGRRPQRLWGISGLLDSPAGGCSCRNGAIVEVLGNTRSKARMAIRTLRKMSDK